MDLFRNKRAIKQKWTKSDYKKHGFWHSESNYVNEPIFIWEKVYYLDS